MSNNMHNWNHLGKPDVWTHLPHVAVGRNLDGQQEVFATDTQGALW